MTITTKLASAAVAALVLTTSFAQAGGISATYDPNKIRIKPIATCLVAGTPSEFPDDIWLQNGGAATLKAGAKIKWSVAFSGDHGTYTLVADLAPGKGLYLNGVLPGGVEAGHDCKASVL